MDLNSLQHFQSKTKNITSKYNCNTLGKYEVKRIAIFQTVHTLVRRIDNSQNSEYDAHRRY